MRKLADEKGKSLIPALRRTDLRDLANVRVEERQGLDWGPICLHDARSSATSAPLFEQFDHE